MRRRAADGGRRTGFRFAVPLLLAVAATSATTVGGQQVTKEQGAPSAVRRPRVPAGSPRTRAERSNWTETSSYADVVGFLDSLQRVGATFHRGSIGRSTEGREIPYVVLSTHRVRTPGEARRLGLPVVYLQGNIHAGEVEGKEALQMLVHDLSLPNRIPNSPDTYATARLLDSLVIVVVPIYNVDGNERLASQAKNRTEQNGPELVGERANAMGLDLNRDYVKAEAPETRASLAMFAQWDPDVFVDLHTTNGSYHGYALTYAPSLHPAAAHGPFTIDTLLPALRRRVRERHGFETFDYGNFALQYGADVTADTTKQGWFTYDHRPRFGTNYYGLRGRIAVLGEAYSHDPFERRVASTYAFVRELLSWVAEHRERVIARSAEADRFHGDRPAYGGGLSRMAAQLSGDAKFGSTGRIALRAELTKKPRTGPVIAEDLAVDTATTGREPGVAKGFRRTGRYRTVNIPIHDRFEGTLDGPPPAGWFLDASQDTVVALLRRHGVLVERLLAPATVEVTAFTVDSVVVAPRPFQGHREVRLAGRWGRPEARRVDAGSWFVSARQPLGVLAMILLEPESDDSFGTWNAFDRWLRPGAPHPVLRTGGMYGLAEVPLPRALVP